MVAVAEQVVTSEYIVDSKRFPYDRDFAAAIRHEEVCGPRHALPGNNSFGGEIVTGDDAYDEGGAWRRMRTCKELLAWTCGELLDRVYQPLVDALWRRGINPHDLEPGLLDRLLEDAVERIHNSDRMPTDAAESVARDVAMGWR